jgi:hypothetical protein
VALAGAAPVVEHRQHQAGALHPGEVVGVEELRADRLRGPGMVPEVGQADKRRQVLAQRQRARGGRPEAL